MKTLLGLFFSRKRKFRKVDLFAHIWFKLCPFENNQDVGAYLLYEGQNMCVKRKKRKKLLIVTDNFYAYVTYICPTLQLSTYLDTQCVPI